MNKFIMIAAFAASIFSAQTGFAQKYGHMNLGNFLESLPQVAEANKQLQTVGQSYGVKLDSMENELRTYYTQVNEQANSGQLTRLQIETHQKSLEVKQNALQAYSEESEKAVAAKRQELLEPILKKVEDAVKLVAKENNYLMIFDTSVGATLYVAESDDVTSLVRQKM